MVQKIFFFKSRSEKTCFLHVCENKGADQLHVKRAANLSAIDSTIPLLPNPKFQASSCVSDLVGNPEDRFSQDTIYHRWSESGKSIY